ncbi:Metal cation transporter ZIP family [Paragonimus heterotremus]|uniref:Metal cation transporter ZIP family n=1 Tax=Paragonimus heterotremus TaxID=100268 RepID=A0A8J4TJP7_9TREM|nr:Metal cation transporter ZIP family [Paragonimus heterotremus]
MRQSLHWVFVFLLLIYFCYNDHYVDARNPVPTATSQPGSTVSVNSTEKGRPPQLHAILYGLLATTVTNLAALSGFVFAPLHKCSGYSTLMSFMIATAVGSLFTTAVMVLIPEAFRLSEFVNDTTNRDSNWYVPTSLSVCAGTFLFFVLEFAMRRMQLLLERRSSNPVVTLRASYRSRTCSIEVPCDNSAESKAGADGDFDGDLNPPVTRVINGFAGLSQPVQTNQCSSVEPSFVFGRQVEDDKPLSLCSKNLCMRLGRLDPVVWMIVIGDGLHNFMDGLSIGAGFMNDLRLGLSVTLAVLCEELPHELGDIAILLQSGMSASLAVLFNFGSACTAYMGFFLGVFLGELPQSAMYIFAVTAGFFLYISLADMLPEMRKTEDQHLEANRNISILFAVHCAGLLFGFGCILTVTYASKYIAI